MKNNRQICIMGGTFNPIHNGHIELAKRAHKQFNLDEVIFIPSGDPPHKPKELILPAEYRCDMVKLAIKPYDFMTFSDIEIKRQGFTYSADTLTEYEKYYDTIYFIIGADSLFNLKYWYHPEIVMAKSILLVANRDKHNPEVLQNIIEEYHRDYNARIHLIDMPDYPVSSTTIRTNIENGLPIDEYVPADVELYIQENHLYQ